MKARSMRRISVSSQVLISDVPIVSTSLLATSVAMCLTVCYAPTGQGIVVLNLSHVARYISTDTII